MVKSSWVICWSVDFHLIFLSKWILLGWTHIRLACWPCICIGPTQRLCPLFTLKTLVPSLVHLVLTKVACLSKCMACKGGNVSSRICWKAILPPLGMSIIISSCLSFVLCSQMWCSWDMYHWLNTFLRSKQYWKEGRFNGTYFHGLW